MDSLNFRETRFWNNYILLRKESPINKNMWLMLKTYIFNSKMIINNAVKLFLSYSSSLPTFFYFFETCFANVAWNTWMILTYWLCWNFFLLNIGLSGDIFRISISKNSEKWITYTVKLITIIFLDQINFNFTWK